MGAGQSAWQPPDHVAGTVSELRVDRERNAVVVVPPAEIDVGTESQFTDSLRNACALSPSRVIVDFTDVTFCDSTALRVLVQESARLSDAGCSLEVHKPTRSLRRIAALTGMSRRLGLDDARS
jgi:anti-anti-sigma factor